MGVAAALAVVALAYPTAASADTATFLPTGAEQTFVVPSGVTSLHAIAIGGRGAAGQNGGAGGLGATASADLAVTPGQVLFIEVGGNGTTGGSGGFNGGGATGQVGGNAGGGGGGASDIRTASRAAGTSLALRLLVAGGGGGGGGSSQLNSGGTAGVAPSAGQNGTGSVGGGPGTATAGGAGGAGCASGSNGAASGILGAGGAGSSDKSCLGAANGGGGGGGGLFGGGGGGTSSQGSGGGGGSSGFGSGATNTAVTTDVTGAPSISLIFNPSPGASPAPKTCTVPNLAGRKLKGARKALRSRDCKLGATKRKSRHARRIVGQNPKPGKILPAGTEVNVTLGGGNKHS